MAPIRGRRGLRPGVQLQQSVSERCGDHEGQIRSTEPVKCRAIQTQVDTASASISPRAVERLRIVDARTDSRLSAIPVSYTHLRAHETRHDLVCRLLLE